VIVSYGKIKTVEKKPRVLQLGAESTFEGGGDKPSVYTKNVAMQHFEDNLILIFWRNIHGMHRQLDR
jgi:hypothetical protein